MERKYIKLNDNYSHLSLGNIIWVIKDESKNKTSAIQSEVFCALMEIQDINESTVNNYCIGSRSIGNDYKQIYINLKRKYINNKDIFINIICNIISIMDGNIFDIKNINKINVIESFQNITKKLYNISKNDFSVSKDLISKLRLLIKKNDYYSAFIEMALFAILDKKQPLYEDEKTKNMIEIILQNTDISVNDLQNFLLLELNEGINFSHSLINLANEGNAYALYHLAILEYRGEFAGFPRYDKAFEYFLKSAENNHPSAYWMLGNMIIKNKIGNKEYKEAFNYFEKAKELGNVAAINSLGLCYKFGYGVNKDINKALTYFKEAAQKNYAYAFNNLALYYESEKDYNKSYEYFMKSANLNESFACNKIGEIERIKGNKNVAYNYYNKAISCVIRETSLWAYYNLAKYYYLDGDLSSKTLKNIDMAINYFEKSSPLLESLIELLYIYFNKYTENGDEQDLKKVIYYKTKIEKHKDYNNDTKNNIEKMLNKIKKIDKINLPIS